jgi:crossover junction endodeoxyribonuclease RuvC
MPSPSIILGIDPGTQTTGYGVIRHHSHRFETIDYGCIRPPRSLDLPQKLLILFNAIDSLLERFQPDAVSVETQFVYKNVQTAIKLGMARGSVLLAASRRNIPIFEYAPKKAKIAVVGTGLASKEQVQKMVQFLLKLPMLPEPEDAADALALAICHANSQKTILIKRPDHVRVH